MRMKKNIGYFLTLLFFTISQTLSAQSYGTWNGSASQDANPALNMPASSYAVSLKLSGQGGTIDFPSLGCGGTVSYISGQRGGTYTYRENLSYGTGKCLGGLNIRFSLVNLTTMNWEETDPQGNSLTHGTLTRAAPPAVNILIKRIGKKITPNKIFKCTQGMLSVNGEYFCNTLELAFDNDKNYVSSIAVGQYDAAIISTGNHPDGVIALKNVKSNVYRLNDNGEWKIYQVDRNINEPVEIHNGNEPYQSKGCILVGSAFKPTDDCFVSNSVATLKKLYTVYFDTDANGSPNPDVEVTVSITHNY